MRLVTRGDLDGLTCAVLICLNETIDRILLIHPQDITDDRVKIEEGDIIANLPYHPNCSKWFDHHLHTATATARPESFDGRFGQAPSAARLVYEYYGGEEKMPQYEDLVYETDRLDSADLDPIDVLNPEGYVKIGFTIDGRTGLGAFEGYFHTLMGLLLRNTPLDEIMEHEEVKRRCQLMDEENRAFRDALKKHTRVEDNVIITDFRPLDEVPVGNRFLVYALFEEGNVSVRLQWGPQRKFQMMTLGHSIFDRSCNTNVGELAARYGGGGHKGAGSIPLMEDPEMQIQMIIAELKRNG